MKPLPVSKQNDKVQTFVHVSATASAEDDLRNLERVRRIMSWESGRKIPIYPPREIRLESTRPKTPESKNESTVQEEEVSSSPSQIPDSQPATPIFSKPQLQHDFFITPALVSHQTPISATPANSMPTVYQSPIPPPPAVSLGPLKQTPKDPTPTEPSPSPDFPSATSSLLTSTPISPPLKSFLSDLVLLPLSFMCIPIPTHKQHTLPISPHKTDPDCRTTAASPSPCQKQTPIKSPSSPPTSPPSSLSPSSDVTIKLGTWRTGRGVIGGLICFLGEGRRNLSFGKR